MNKSIGLIDYENSQNKVLFRKTIYDIKTDYEFLKEFKNPFKDESDRLGLPAFARISLYFNKIDNNTCEELITKIKFIRTNDNSFYNEETGLYFNFNNYFERAVGHEKIINTDEYALFVSNYINYFKNIKCHDDKKRYKGMNLLLKNGKCVRG